MTWIDNKNAYDTAPQSSLKMYKIPGQVIQFIEKTMQTWRVELTPGGKSLAEVKDPKRHIPGRCTITICDSHDTTQQHPLEMHRLFKTQLIAGKKLNHLMYMDDIKLFA